MMLHLILREAYHRKWSFLLSVLAMVTAVALFVAFYTTGEASQRETTRLMRDIGYNLRIIPEDTDMDRFYLTGFSERTMPEEYVERFATQKGFSYAHLLAMLQQSVSVADQKVLLTGIGVEVAPRTRRSLPGRSDRCSIS